MTTFEPQHHHSYWKGKPLPPRKLLIHDIGLDNKTRDGPRRMQANEISAWSILPDLNIIDNSKIEAALGFDIDYTTSGATKIEEQKLRTLTDQYGWLKSLRLPEGKDDSKQCRWIHVSSKFPEYLRGAFVGLSDWSTDPEATLYHLRQLDRCMHENERFSKHGKYFSPFVRCLNHSDGQYPMLLSIPFIDWTIFPGPTPPLRFQIDEREIYTSSRNAIHPLRSLLQYYYRLEDTEDRERSQVFYKHRPWHTDREIDLKVRRWYGHYPSGLNVDELWVLAVDPNHIITFSSNQSWKSRWPATQLSSRISEISFRAIRQMYLESGGEHPYTALTHVMACLNGAVGLIHRSFWSDMPLPCSDRFGGYLSHLQYRIYRAPSTRLVMDLLQTLDELNIILQLMKGQYDVILELESIMENCIRQQRPPAWHENVDSNPLRSYDMAIKHDSNALPQTDSRSRASELDGQGFFVGPRTFDAGSLYLDVPSPVREIRNSLPDRRPNPLLDLKINLKRELDDFRELQTNCNMLVNRTVQLVNIRLEDHGQAILVFTIVTIVFLPLSFVSSYFGMNFADIRNSAQNQPHFWIWGAIVTCGTLFASCLLAFYGGKWKERAIIWRDRHSFDPRNLLPKRPHRVSSQADPRKIQRSFTVLDGSQAESSGIMWSN